MDAHQSDKPWLLPIDLCDVTQPQYWHKQGTCAMKRDKNSYEVIFLNSSGVMSGIGRRKVEEDMIVNRL